MGQKARMDRMDVVVSGKNNNEQHPDLKAT